MRFAVFLAFAGLACQSAVPQARGGNVKFRVLETGGRAQYQGSARQLTYAPNEEVYKRVWASIVGSGDPPPIDFSREAALFIAAGQRPTGGYNINVKSIRTEHGVLVVDAAVDPPGPDVMVIQVFTSPFVVLAIEKVDVSSANWKNAEAQ